MKAHSLGSRTERGHTLWVQGQYEGTLPGFKDKNEGTLPGFKDSMKALDLRWQGY